MPNSSALVHTRNSIYRVTGSGTHYRFLVQAYDMLAQGYSPDDVTKFHRLMPSDKSEGEGDTDEPDFDEKVE
ncbi:hypothetical protein GCM10009109_26490 [Marinobacterium sediminicola]